MNLNNTTDSTFVSPAAFVAEPAVTPPREYRFKDVRPFEMKLETNVPLPRRQPPPPRKRKYDFDSMKPGMSFFAAKEDESRVHRAFFTWAKRYGKKTATRARTENGVVGRRFWLIK